MNPVRAIAALVRLWPLARELPLAARQASRAHAAAAPSEAAPAPPAAARRGEGQALPAEPSLSAWPSMRHDAVLARRPTASPLTLPPALPQPPLAEDPATVLHWLPAALWRRGAPPPGGGAAADGDEEPLLCLDLPWRGVRVQVLLRGRAQSLSLTLVSDDDLALRALRQALPALMQALAQAGLRVRRLQWRRQRVPQRLLGRAGSPPGDRSLDLRVAATALLQVLRRLESAEGADDAQLAQLRHLVVREYAEPGRE